MSIFVTPKTLPSESPSYRPPKQFPRRASGETADGTGKKLKRQRKKDRRRKQLKKVRIKGSHHVAWDIDVARAAFPIFPGSEETTVQRPFKSESPTLMEESVTHEEPSFQPTATEKSEIDYPYPLSRQIVNPPLEASAPWDLVIRSTVLSKTKKLMRLQDLISFSSSENIANFIAEIFLEFRSRPWDQNWFFYILKLIILCHSETIVSVFSPYHIPSIFSKGIDVNTAGAFLLYILKYKANHLQTASPSPHCIGLSEATALLTLCMKTRGGLDVDPRFCPPSLYRKWLCKIWLDIPSSRPTTPHLIELLLFWINQDCLGSKLEDKEDCFILLSSEVDFLGANVGPLWCLASFLELVDRNEGDVNQDLQHVLFLIDKNELQFLTRRLINHSSKKPSELLQLWIHLIVFATVPPPPPSFLQGIKSFSTYAPPQTPLFDLLNFLLKAFYKYSPDMAANYNTTREISHSMFEGALRITICKASNPINAQDAYQLFSHLLITGPYAFKAIPGLRYALESIIPFLNKTSFLYRESKMIGQTLLVLSEETLRCIKILMAKDEQASPRCILDFPWWEEEETPSKETKHLIDFRTHRRSTSFELSTQNSYTAITPVRPSHSSPSTPYIENIESDAKKVALILTHMARHGLVIKDGTKHNEKKNPEITSEKHTDTIERSVQTDHTREATSPPGQLAEQPPPTVPSGFSETLVNQLATPEPFQNSFHSIPAMYSPMLPTQLDPMVTTNTQINPYFVPTTFGFEDFPSGVYQTKETEVQPTASTLSLSIPSTGAKRFKYPKTFVGLCNLGNTCYMNSLLQVLFLTQCFLSNLFDFKFISNLPQDPSLPPVTPNKKLLRQLKILFAAMVITDEPQLSPQEFRRHCPKSYAEGGSQHDVTEFSRDLFSELGGQQQPLIRLTFGGEIAHKVKCRRCQYVSERKETIQDLGLGVTLGARDKNSKKKYPTIEALIEKLVEKEVLHGDNKYRCDSCKKKVVADKWMEIVSPPAHLFIVLNRYAWDAYSDEKKKLNTIIKVSNRMALLNYTYSLYAAIFHRGPSANTGHYYTIGRRSESKEKTKWHNFNDSVISSCNVDDINNIPLSTEDEVPYVLLYRCNQAPPSPPLFIPKKYVHLAKRVA